LHDAYLETWGNGSEEAFELAMRVGAFGQTIAWTRQRDHLSAEDRPEFDTWFSVVLQRAITRIDG
jgi:hypothetical protein